MRTLVNFMVPWLVHVAAPGDGRTPEAAGFET